MIKTLEFHYHDIAWKPLYEFCYSLRIFYPFFIISVYFILFELTNLKEIKLSIIICGLNHINQNAKNNISHSYKGMIFLSEEVSINI